MGAVVLSRSNIGAGAMIAAGAVVGRRRGRRTGALMMGVPAKERQHCETLRRTSDVRRIAPHYQRNAARFAETLEQIETESNAWPLMS